MKLPITDKFLWDVIEALDKTEDALRFFTHPARSMRDVALSTDSYIYQKYRKILHTKDFAWLIYYLKKNNFITVKSLKGNRAIMLTHKGYDKAIVAHFKTQNNKVKRKDGKWIMLIFDIPEKQRGHRDLLRSILYNLGYKMFQQSVWVTPYDVLKKTETLIQIHSLDEYVKIFLIEEIK